MCLQRMCLLPFKKTFFPDRKTFLERVWGKGMMFKILNLIAILGCNSLNRDSISFLLGDFDKPTSYRPTKIQVLLFFLLAYPANWCVVWSPFSEEAVGREDRGKFASGNILS